MTYPTLKQLVYSLPVINRSSEVIFRCQTIKKLQKAPFVRQRGVTLLEMLIALAVAAIVLTVVAPNMQTIVAKNRITAEINQVSSIIQYARFNAIDENSPTLVCPSPDFEACSNNWNQAKIVFVDANNNGQRDSSEPLLVSAEAISSSNYMKGPAAAIEFSESGATNVSEAISDTVSIVLCDSAKTKNLTRALLINQQGRVRISIDSDGDDIHEDASGNALNCE